MFICGREGKQVGPSRGKSQAEMLFGWNTATNPVEIAEGKIILWFCLALEQKAGPKIMECQHLIQWSH
jgi:hypothetical protein